MAREINMETLKSFHNESLMRKYHAKTKCHSTGDLQMEHKKDKWKQSES